MAKALLWKQTFTVTKVLDRNSRNSQIHMGLDLSGTIDTHSTNFAITVSSGLSIPSRHEGVGQNLHWFGSMRGRTMAVVTDGLSWPDPFFHTI